MNKIAIAGVLLVAVLVGVYMLSWQRSAEQTASADYKNIAYMLDGASVKLTAGVAETEAAPGSAAKVVTKFFGNEGKGDINGDGIPDLAFILTQESGGSGTFFYVVGAVQQPDGSYKGTDGVLLGDRIAPQTTEVSEGIVTVNYADRAPGEPMSAQPSIGKSVRLKLDTQSMMFGLVADNFEGEANPAMMTLEMKRWEWVKAEYSDGTTITPKQPGKFALTFTADKFTGETDCNSMSGSHTVNGTELSFGPIAMTRMFCEGSQEGDFAKILENTAQYHFTGRGELILDLKMDSGTATFR